MDVKTDLEWVTNEIVTLLNKRSYAKLVIVIDDGKIKHVVQELSLKPPSYYKESKNNP